MQELVSLVPALLLAPKPGDVAWRSCREIDNGYMCPGQYMGHKRGWLSIQYLIETHIPISRIPIVGWTNG